MDPKSSFVQTLSLDTWVLLVPLLSMGCDGPGVCHGEECGGNSQGSGNFVPGPLPDSALELDGVRCAKSVAELTIFQRNVLTQPAVPTPVTVADNLIVYWSVCNSGNASSAAMPNSYDFVVFDRATDPDTELSREPLGVSALQACRCEVIQRPFNGGAPNTLPAGSYTFALERLFDADTNRVISP